VTPEARVGTAALVGIYATFALDVFSTLNSSPQTTELFAGDREDSLMHWVWIGGAVAVAGGVAGSAMAGNLWPLVGAVLVAGGMVYAYRHAVERGTGSDAPRGASR
jgi:hypothetical protein